MADAEKSDIEPEDTGEGVLISHRKGRRAFRTVRRELSDDELASPSIQRMLIDELERLEEENKDLMEYRNRYYDADKNVAVLGEKVKVAVAQDVLFAVCLTVGRPYWGTCHLSGVRSRQV